MQGFSGQERRRQKDELAEADCAHVKSDRVQKQLMNQSYDQKKQMAYLIMEGGNALQIEELAKKEGVKNLRESGLKKVKEGLISLIELNRVFK